MSGMIISTTLWKGWRFPGTGPLPTFDLLWLAQNCPAFLVTQIVKNMPAMQETWVQFLGQEDPLEKGMVTAWRIPQTAVYGVTKSLTGLSD